VTKVLVVDDEPAILRVVRASLLARLRAVTATTGEDAIASMRSTLRMS
jgi:CheY-like chemotaxis protein